MSQGSKLIYVPIYFPLQRCIEMDIIMVPILQIKKLRPKEIKTLHKVTLLVSAEVWIPTQAV